MGCFRNFTAPDWELFAGNSLFLLCSLFYLLWWVVIFRPGSSVAAPGTSATSVALLIPAFLTGIGALILMSLSIGTLARESKALPVKFIVIGAAILYIVLLLITFFLFHRQVTSELLIMHIWAAFELSALIVLYGTGCFGIGQTAALITLIALAAVAGLICYVLYYRLGGYPSFIDGVIPLGADALVMAVFLVMMAFS